MKKIITSSMGLIMTVLLLSGVVTSVDSQQVETTNDTQYTHGEPWG